MSVSVSNDGEYFSTLKRSRYENATMLEFDDGNKEGQTGGQKEGKEGAQGPRLVYI